MSGAGCYTCLKMTISKLETLTLNQIKAGRELAKIFPGKNLERSLCLLAAAGTAINFIFQKRLINETRTNRGFSLEEVYRAFLPLAGRFANPKLPLGFLLTDTFGNMYHHVAIALANALGLEGVSVGNVTNLSSLEPYIQPGEKAVVVSLRNDFIWEQTLKMQPPKTLSWQKGRHAVAILGFNENRVTITDSFNRQQPERRRGVVVRLPLDVAEYYLKDEANRANQAIIFSRTVLDNLPFKQNNILIPPEVITHLRKTLNLERLEKENLDLAGGQVN